MSACVRVYVCACVSVCVCRLACMCVFSSNVMACADKLTEHRSQSPAG